MARPRAYDEEAALAGAMEVFRRKGFEATSVRDLELATGLKSGSIYNSFGDKRQLFEAAAAHYNRVVLERRLALHAPPEQGVEGLRQLFLSLLDEPGGGAHGCLITNSAVEFGGGAGPEAQPGFVAEAFATLKRVFQARLGDDADAAMALLALYQGLLVLIRAGVDKDLLRRTIDTSFQQLEKSHDAD